MDLVVPKKISIGTFNNFYMKNNYFIKHLIIKTFIASNIDGENLIIVN